MSKSTEPVDFSDRVVSAYNKFTYMASFSIAASSFTISEDTGFLGIEFKNIPERGIEVVLFASTCILAANYWLRFSDERKVFSNIDNSLRSWEGEITSLHNKLQSSSKDLAATIKHFETELEVIGTSDNSLNRTVSYLDQLKAVVERFETSDNLDGHANSIFQEDLGEIRSQRPHDTWVTDTVRLHNAHQKKLGSNVDEVRKELKILDGMLNEIVKQNHPILTNRTSPLIAKIRIGVIDFFVPLVLLGLATYSFLYPNENSLLIFVLNWFEHS